MPIRFRCAYCNQLMAIARRKASTVVRCPTCSGQVIVPEMEAEPPEEELTEPKPSVFDEPDFDKILEGEGKVALHAGPAVAAHVVTAPSAAPARQAGPAPPCPHQVADVPAAVEYDVVRLDPQAPMAFPQPSRPAGLYLSPAKMLILVIATVVVLALTFVGGLMVGFYVRSNLAPAAPQESRLESPLTA